MPLKETFQHYSAISISLQWKQAFTEKNFSAGLILTISYLITLVIILNKFLPYINQRDGIVLYDPLLAIIPPVNLSAWIFGIIYGASAFTFFYLLPHPERCLQTLIALALIYTLRIVTLSLVPLDPPVNCLPLSDPILTRFAYGGVMVTKDLFFSGHTAFMFILVLAIQKKWLKLVMFMGLIIIIVMLLFQHAHYTIDILGALILTPLCWKATQRIFA